MPPPSEGRCGNFCIWFISFLLFLILLTGGAFLLLYITLPQSDDTAWFPAAGMVLVGIPWGFWIMTCVYRCVAVRSGGDRPPDKAVALRPARGGETAGAAASDSPVESPGGSRKVRFAVGPSDRAVAGTIGAPPGSEAGGDSVGKSEDSSLKSRESEMPLAFSMT